MENILEHVDFGNEAADDVDLEELINYFVEQEGFKKFLNTKNKLLIAHARKGVGKSALLRWISHKVSNEDPESLVIYCRGADLVRNKFNLTSVLSTPNDWIRDWMIRLCALVNRQLAKSLNIAFDDDKITLVETAELEGYKSRNLVGCLLDRLQSLLERGSIKKISVANEIEILKRVKNRKVWILIDDLDATYQNTSTESLQLATFFSACRYLFQDMKDIFFRVTIRTDVWAMIRLYDESLDKAEQYVEELLWSQGDFLRLLALRIKSSILAMKGSLPKVPQHVQQDEENEHLLKMVFVEKMEWAKKLVDTYQVLYTLSYERPRWGIQLCKLAKESAIRNRDVLIGKNNIDEVWGSYGTKRIDDLVAEHKHQCQDVKELLNGFRGAHRLMTRDELFSWINKRISTHMDIRIEGKSTRNPMEIARFLYRLGFILARSDSPDGNYEHYRIDQMPDFLTSRTDDDFGLKWEIHPCYRQALDIKKLDHSHREQFRKLRERH
jgi:energy-coupling factor transporter ATP-binding protein EcfA2